MANSEEFASVEVGAFEWDEGKNQLNLAKHGIDFDDAVEIFDGPVLCIGQIATMRSAGLRLGSPTIMSLPLSYAAKAHHPDHFSARCEKE